MSLLKWLTHAETIHLRGFTTAYVQSFAANGEFGEEEKVQFGSGLDCNSLPASTFYGKRWVELRERLRGIERRIGNLLSKHWLHHECLWRSCAGSQTGGFAITALGHM